MAGKLLIKQMLLHRNMTGAMYTRRYNLVDHQFRAKMSRDKFSFKDIQEIANNLDFDIKAVDRLSPNKQIME